MEEQPKTRREKKNEYNETIPYRSKRRNQQTAEKNELFVHVVLKFAKDIWTDHLKQSKHVKELQKRQDLLEEKTNINIANLITSFLI
jgi:hypothetical protein